MSGAGRMMAPLMRRVRGLIGRCILDAVAADAARQTLKVQLLEGELADGVEYFEPFGFTGVPVSGDGLFLAIGSNRSHGAALAVGGRDHRPLDLQPGEACVYNLAGDRLTLRADGTAELISSAAVEITSPLVHCTGDMMIEGDFVAAGQASDAMGSMAEMRGVFNAHTHRGDSGGTTAPPNTRMD